MKSGKPKNAPKVASYNMKKNFMKEADQKGKKLSK
jgi:hypothetical protein